MSFLVDALRSRTEEVMFLNEVLKQYREVRKVYYYEYTEEDKAALAACATDLRPFTHSLLPAIGVYWGSGKLIRNPGSLGTMTRASLLLLRLVATAEALRLGSLVGGYRQAVDCTERLVSLRSPLGGEMAAIIRDRDPQHPLLRLERPPAEMNEDGSRPRIMTEANRQAQIARLQAELSAAKAGQVLDRANERADERLFRSVHRREEVLEELQRGGGPTAAASTGRMETMRPALPPSYVEEYSGGGGSGSAGSSSSSGGSGGVARGSGGGLVISEGAQWQQQQQGQSAAQAGPGSQTTGSGSAVQEQDPFAMLLGGGGSGEWAFGDEQSEEARQAAAEEARRQRQRERRTRWWRRHSGGSGGGGGESH